MVTQTLGMRLSPHFVYQSSGNVSLEYKVITPVGSDLTAKHIALPILSVLIIIGNLTLICVVLRNKRLHTATNVLVTGLSMSDLIMGTCVMPMLVIAEEGLLGTEPMSCLVVMCLTVSHIFISCLIVTLIAIERYVSIKWPLKHRALCNIRNSVLLVTICWCYGLTSGAALPLFGWNSLSMQVLSRNNGTLVYTESGIPWQCRYHAVFSGGYAAFMYLVHFVVLWVCVIVLYLQIYLHSRVATHQSTSSTTRGTSLTRHDKRKNSTTSSKENWRALRVLCVVTGYFVFSWLFLVIWYTALYKGFTRPYISSSSYTPLPEWFYSIGVIFAFSNSAVNPLLYGFGNRSVRNAFMNSIACLTTEDNSLILSYRRSRETIPLNNTTINASQAV